MTEPETPINTSSPSDAEIQSTVEEILEELYPQTPYEHVPTTPPVLQPLELQPLPEQQPGATLYTQIRIAEQFIQGYAENWRYNISRKQWFFWNGTRWEEDICEQIRNADREFLREYIALIPQKTLENQQYHKIIDQLTKFIVGLNTAKGIRDILEIAAPAMTITDDTLDRDNYLLNCLNGALNLRTFELQPHAREDFCSMITGVNYDPDAACPLWKTHMQTIFEKDQKLIDNVQELLGYSLFLGNPDAVFGVGFGSGRNGKSVSLEVISHVLGLYAVSVSPTSFTAEGEKAGSDRLLMKGARLIIASEPKDTSKNRYELDSDFIKQATGDDIVGGRLLYCQGTKFRVKGLVFIITNHLPKISDPTVAMWDRIWCIPFNHYFMLEDRDKAMSDKLKAESPGILNWLITGYRRYVEKTRLEQCGVIKEQTDEYRHDEDYYTPFFDSGVVTVKPTAKIQATRLLDLYDEWLTLQYGDKKKKINKTRFGRDMSTRFKKDKVGVVIYYGIGETGQKELGGK
jgi:putative DNA primase/helicase